MTPVRKMELTTEAGIGIGTVTFTEDGGVLGGTASVWFNTGDKGTTVVLFYRDLDRVVQFARNMWPGLVWTQNRN